MVSLYIPPLSLEDQIRDLASRLADEGWLVHVSASRGGENFALTRAPSQQGCNCASHQRGQLTAGWLCPVHGQQW